MILWRQVWTLIVCLVLAVGLRLVWGESGWTVSRGLRHAVEQTVVVPAPRQLHWGPGVTCAGWDDISDNVACVVDRAVLDCQRRLYDALQEVWGRQWDARGATEIWSHWPAVITQECDDLCRAKQQRDEKQRLVEELEAKQARAARIQQVLKDCKPEESR